MKRHLLFIDDNPMMGAFLSHLFQKEYEVMWYTNAEEALSWLREDNLPAIIVCDYELTGMNGLDFLKQLKGIGFFKNIPVIMLSGKGSDENRNACMEEGAEDFVGKPFNPAELRLKVEHLVSRKEV